MASKEQNPWNFMLMDSMEDDLSCPVCFEIYEDPVTLPCGHTLCKQCCARWYHSRDRVDCPLCKKRLTPEMIRNLDVNIILRNICRDYKGKQRGTNNNTSVSVKTQIENCKDHALEEANFVCMTCRVAFCAVCSVIEKKHVSHEVFSRSKAVEPVKRLLLECHQRFSVVDKRVEKSSSELTTSLENLTVTEESLRAHGHDLKAKFASLVDKQIESFLVSLEKSRTEQIQLMFGKLQDTQTALSEIKSVLSSDVNYQNVVGKVNAFPTLVESLSSLENKCAGVEALKSASMKNFSFQKTDIDLHQLNDIVKKIITLELVEENCFEETITKSEPKISQTNFAAKSSANCQVDKTSACQPQVKNKALVSTRKEVEFTTVTTFNATGYNLSHVAWIDAHILVTHYDDAAIACVNFNTGEVKSVLKLCQGKPLSISAQVRKRGILIAITFLYRDKWKNVLLLNDGNKTNITVDADPCWSREQTVKGIGMKPVSICNDMMAFVSPTGKVLVVDVSDNDLDNIGEYSPSQYPEEVALGKVGTRCSTVYVKCKNKVLESFQLLNSDDKVSYDVAQLENIACLAPDKDGNLWVVDGVQNLLVCYNAKGAIKHLIAHGLPYTICSVHVSKKSIILLCRNKDLGVVSRISLDAI